MNAMKTSILGLGMAVAVMSWAETLSTGFRMRNAVGVDAGATLEQTDPVTQVNGSWFDKTGEGTWKLPLGAVHQDYPFEFGVRAGTVEVDLDSRTRTAPTTPTAVLAKAAAWFDAGVNVVTTNSEGGTSYVTAWLDARETSADPSVRQYAWARPGWDKLDGTTPAPAVPPTLGTFNEKRSVFFGGKNSGKYMALTVSNTTATATGFSCTQVFVVEGVKTTYGFAVSVTSGYANNYHVASTGGGLYPFIVNSTANDADAQRYARFFFNGKHVNGAEQSPIAGAYQLLDYDMPSYAATVNAFFTDRNIAGRAGGDYLAEVVLFTIPLTEAERLAVQRYLMSKWGCYRNAPSVESVVARDASVVLAGEESASPSSVGLAGEGAAVKRGAGTVIIAAPEAGKRFNGELSVEAGRARLVTTDVPLALAAGKELSVVAGSLGEEVTVADAPAGEAVKSGTGHAVATAVGDDVTRLRVTGGTLTLRGRCDPQSVVQGSVTNVVLPDPSFEYYQNDARNLLSGANGWYSSGRYSGSTMDSEAFVWSKLLGAATWPCSYASPDGTMSLCIKADCAAYTKDLTVPETGIYELSFWASARFGNTDKNKSYIDIQIGPDADHLTNIGVTVNGACRYQRQTYLTPVLTAGTGYQLWFRPRFHNLDGMTAIDDVQLRFVSRGARLSEWKIPNGGFEDISATNALNAKLGTTFSTNAVVAGWTFAQSPLGMASAINLKREQCSVGVIIPGNDQSVDSGNGSFQCYSAAYQREGGARLLLCTTGSVARTTFTPPAGTWRLKAEMQRVRFNYLQAMEANIAPSVGATLATADGATADLGTTGTTVLNMGMEDVIWPNAVTTDGTTAYTLTISNVIAKSSVFMDNLVLLPVEDTTYEYLSNGSFETTDAWTYVADPTHTAQTKTCRMEYAFLPGSMGSTKYDGSYYAYVVAAGAVVQDVLLPKAGAYRLTLNLSTRYDSAGGTGSGLNPLRAWVAQGGVTNEIGRTLANGTNFLQRAFVFTVPAAGTYRIGIQGTIAGEDRVARVDGVSLRAAGELAAATEASPSLSRGLRVVVASGATLDLDFAGTNLVRSVSLGGQRVKGIVSAETYPDYVTGRGVLNAVSDVGMVLIFR